MSNKTFEAILQDFIKKTEKNAKKINNQFVIEATKLKDNPEYNDNFNEKILELQQETEQKILELQEKKQKDLQKAFIEILNINENANYVTLPIFEREGSMYILQIPYHYTLKAITIILDLYKKIHKMEEQTVEFYQNSILSLSGINLLEKISLNKRNLAELKDFDFENEPLAMYPLHACHIPSIIHILGMWVMEYQELALKKK